MADKSIVVVGSCMMDFVCYAPRLPKEGETILGTKFSTNFGGKGANQCVAAAKLGGNTTMVARVGDDVWGERYIQNFQNFGINSQYVQKTPNHSNGIAQITVSETGANNIVIVPGANSQLNVNDLKVAQQAIENAAVLVTQLETKPEVAMKSLELCKGVSILNGAPAICRFDAQLITSPNIFCVNETEASVFSGLTVKTVNDAKKAVRILLEKGCKCVILTLGSQGAVFASRDYPIAEHVPSPKIDCVDSTGAGDAFIGALAFLLTNGKDLPLKATIAAACFIAADCCRRPGTQISYPGADILEECFKNDSCL